MGVRSRTRRKINALLQAEGPVFFCTECDAALAMRRYLKDMSCLSDGAGGKVEVAQFSRAGGAVAEGHNHMEETRCQEQLSLMMGPTNTRYLAPALDDESWFPGWSFRNALCRTCGKHI